jgi:chromosome partitioning protein
MPLSTHSEASSFAVGMFDGSMFPYYAIPKLLEIIEGAKERYNPALQTAEILFSLVDARAKENEVMEESIDEDYPGLKFNSIIRKKVRQDASDFRIAELKKALEYYIPFVEDLKICV